MKDYLTFDKMITPIIIQVIFWIGVLCCLVVAGVSFYQGLGSRGGLPSIALGILALVIGPLVVRMYCELMIVIFTINKNVAKIARSKCQD